MKTSWRMTPVGMNRVLFSSILLILIQNAIALPTSSNPRPSPLKLHDQKEASGDQRLETNSNNYNKHGTVDDIHLDSLKTKAHLIDPVGDSSSQLPDDLTQMLGRNYITPEVQKHLLSKRQVRNEYERFYMCLFTLFTNPDCRQRTEFNNANNNANMADPLSNPYETRLYNQDSDTTSSHQFIPLMPNNNQHQRPLSFLGLGLNGLGQGLGFNGYQNNFQQQQPLPIQQPMFESNVFAVTQTPYPEPQVNRRPGTESLKKQHEFYPFIPAIKLTTTTTLKPSTTIPWFLTPTPTPKTTQAPVITTSPFGASTKPQPNFEEFTSAEFHPQDLLAVSASSEQIDSTTSTKGLLNCDNHADKQAQRPSTSSSGLIDDISTSITSQESAASLLFEKRFQMYGKLEEENRDLKSQAVETQEQLQSYQVQTKYLQEALTSVQEDGTKLKKRVSTLERTNNDLQQQNGLLQHSTSDQKTQINELNSKVKYLEEKLLSLSRQNLPLTREIQRHQREVRELETKLKKLSEENRECRNQVYQIQLMQTQKFRQESEDNEKNNRDKLLRGDEEVIGQDVLVLNEGNQQGSNLTPDGLSLLSNSSSSEEVTTEQYGTTNPEPEPEVVTSPSISILTSTTEPALPTDSKVSLDDLATADPQFLKEFTEASKRDVTDEDGQFNPYLFRLPSFPRIFDQRANLGYGQNQDHYRNV